MMSSTSLNKFRPALHLYRGSVKRTIGLTALITVFILLICPGYLLIDINDYFNRVNTPYDVSTALPAITCFITVVTTASAMFYLFLNFNFLYSRNSSDFYHSLPLTRRQLLFSRFAASIVPVILPTTLTYASMCGIVGLEKVNGSVKEVILGYGLNLLILIACSAFTLIFIICAGSITDLLISFASFNIGIIAITFILISLADKFLFGYSGNGGEEIMYSVSPFLFSVIKLIKIFKYNIDAREITLFIAKLLLLTTVCLILSYLLYEKRKSEKSGDSYAYRFIYLVCAAFVGFVGAFGLGLLFSDGSYNYIYWIFAAFGSILAAITFGAVTDRGFKTIKKSIILGTSSYMAMLLTSIIFATGAFGYSSRLPEKADIESLELVFQGDLIKFDNPTDVISLHKEIIKHHESDFYDFISINYKLKNGKNLERSYQINYNNYIDKLLIIYKNPENIQSLKNKASQFQDAAINISEHYINQEGTYFSRFDEAKITKSELNQIINTYVSEIPKATEKTINQTNITNYYISGNSKDNNYISMDLLVEDNFTATIKLLKNLKLKERIVANEIK